MEVVKNYQPEVIRFQLPDDIEIPVKLGEFETEEEAREFMAKTFVATQIKDNATRYMDDFEKDTLRKEYQIQLEDVLPEVEAKAAEKRMILEQAKQEAKNAEELVHMVNTQIKDLAKEVKAGVVTIPLDYKNTWRVPVAGKYYFVTLIAGELLVAKVTDIPEYEKNDVINSGDNNLNAINKIKIA